MVNGARTKAEELGYALDVFWAFEPGVSERRLEEILQARGIDGLVLLSVQPGELGLEWTRYASACLGRPETPVVPFAFTDFFSATRLAYKQTHAAGYRRIGLVIDDRHDRLTEGRCVGACVATQPVCAGAEWINPLVVQEGELDAQVLERWLGSERPDAVLFFRNRVPELLAERVARGARPLGYADLDLPTYDGMTAGIWLPHDRIGAAGVELVNERLQRGERGWEGNPPAIGMPGRWQDGATLPKCSSHRGAPASRL